MARIALVTGGTRGIGRAISLVLKEAGARVAANYAANDDAANAFKDETASKSLSSTSAISTPARTASPRSKPT